MGLTLTLLAAGWMVRISVSGEQSSRGDCLNHYFTIDRQESTQRISSLIDCSVIQEQDIQFETEEQEPGEVPETVIEILSSLGHSLRNLANDFLSHSSQKSHYPIRC